MTGFIACYSNILCAVQIRSNKTIGSIVTTFMGHVGHLKDKMWSALVICLEHKMKRHILCSEDLKVT